MGGALSKLRVADLSDTSTTAQNLYDPVDEWDASTLLGRAYTLFHPLEPRALIWVYITVIPIIIGCVVAFIDQSLTALFHLKHRYIGHTMADWAGENGWKLLLCSVVWGLISVALIGTSYLWSRKMAYGTAGRGVPRVLAHLNGVYMPHWGHFRILCTKIFSVIITVLAGVPYDFVGNICEIGGMIGSCSLSRHPRFQKLVPFAKYFRNSRDARLIIAIGIASAAAAAFRSPIGGLALLIELSAVKFNVRFLYRVFFSCCVCGLVIQLIYTHLYGWEPRNLVGKWDMLPLSQLAQLTENLLTVVPAVVLGVVGGLFQGLFAIVSNFVLNRPQLKSIQTLLFVSFVHGVLIYTLSGAFGLSDECRPFITSSSAFVNTGTPPYLHTSMFCEQKFNRANSSTSNSTAVNSSTTTTTLLFTSTTPGGMITTTLQNGSWTTSPEPAAAPEYVNAFASLTLGFDSSILRLLFRRNVPQFWTAAELGATVAIFSVLLPFLTVLSIVDGDVLMPTGLLGGCVGQLFYLACGAAGLKRDWIDGGLFALLGAVSFIGGMTRLTFSLTFLFVDYAGDVRHVLFIMMAISVARAVADRVSPVRIDYIVMKYQGFAILDFALRIEKYDSVTLHEFQQRNLRVIPPTATVGQLTRLLKTSFHNAFPVIDPVTQSFIGLVHRRTLQLLVWGFSDSIPPELQHPEEWIGIVPDGALQGGASLVATHDLSHRVGGDAVQSGALHSICLTAPSLHNPRGQFESFFSGDFSGSSPTGPEPTSPTTGRPLRHPSSPAYLRSSSPVSSTASTPVVTAAALEQQPGTPAGSMATATNAGAATAGAAATSDAQQALRERQHQAVLQDDFDRFDEVAAALEFHRLRDLDDYLFNRFAEGDAALLQFAHNIKPERSEVHRTFMEEAGRLPDDVKSTVIRLTRYCDRSVFTARASFCVSRLYNMFTVLGLRHAVIVDYQNRPTGVITRRDLMTYRILEKKKNLARVGLYGNSAAVDDVVMDTGDKEGRDEAIPGAPTAAAAAVAGNGDAPAGGNLPTRGSTVCLSRFYDDEVDKAKLLALDDDEPSSPRKQSLNKDADAQLQQQQQQHHAAAAQKAASQSTSDIEIATRGSSDIGSAGSAGSGTSSHKALALPMYKVNRMRPPMLLPKGWNGSGGSDATPAAAAQAALTKRNSSGSAGGDSDKNSYATIVSDRDDDQEDT